MLLACFSTAAEVLQADVALNGLFIAASRSDCWPVRHWNKIVDVNLARIIGVGGMRSLDNPITQVLVVGPGWILKFARSIIAFHLRAGHTLSAS